MLWKVKQLLAPHQRKVWISDDPPGRKLSYKVPPIASPQEVLASSVAIYAIAITASCLAFDVLVSLENVMTMEAHQ
ncbi:hypothetical protein [Kamptonema animale]|uniref:hypothetical protein n=1 Tax=Kamptonema animale TaxID=92934 RepID=UPI00232A7E4E|nr:hypothetical protein [Kamptonema animale]